ncbi:MULTISPECIES: hypothetical protein [unclassified Nocardioides]|uniref:hypothetical protein n=1 Tax=unclassified Nocardioides TaxID=2615069 RepID=UPI0005A13A23|nr:MULTISPECIES: hypothetical protein [unclassified Nocardioides]
MLAMTAALQEIPPDHRGGYELARADLSATAASYDEALERIREQLRPGWRIPLSASTARVDPQLERSRRSRR